MHRNKHSKKPMLSALALGLGKDDIITAKTRKITIFIL